MSADWWLEDVEACECSDLHDWNVTYNLNRMLWEAGWKWGDDDPTQGLHAWIVQGVGMVWPAELAGIRAGDLGEKVLMVVTQLRERPTHFKQWDPPNLWGDYDGLLATFESFLRSIEAHPDARLGVSF